MIEKTKEIFITIKLIASALFLMLNTSLYATNCDSTILETESAVYRLMLQISINKQESENEISRIEVMRLMDSIITLPCAFSQKFDSLERVMSILDAPDHSFRIFNWSYIHSDGTYTYFAYLLRKNDDESVKIFKLTDASDSLVDPQFLTLDKTNWYGCLYYDVIKSEYNNKNYYTLLGWDGNDLFSTRKIIETLVFSKVGEPTFGKNIFKGYEPKVKRIILEYSQKSSMTLRYNQQKELIVFDHLAPSKNIYSGHYNYYGTDFTFDAFVFVDGKWEYHTDIDIRNPKPLKKKKK